MGFVSPISKFENEIEVTEDSASEKIKEAIKILDSFMMEYRMIEDSLRISRKLTSNLGKRNQNLEATKLIRSAHANIALAADLLDEIV